MSPLLPETLIRSWKMLVAVKEPEADVKLWVAMRVVKEADAPLVALLFNVDCRLATFSMVRVPGGRFTDPAPMTLRFPETVAVVKEVAPVTLRVPDTVAFCKEVVPMIVGLFVEAAPIIAGSRV
jgi:hypothetical protein